MPTRPPTHRPFVRVRGTSARRGYSSRWQRYRKAFLTEHPLCVACEREGRTTAATDVDHVQPVRGADDPAFWPDTNHQALCHACHSKKTAAERRGG